MNKLVRFYNQNRHIVWMILLIIFAIIALIQILNNYVSENNKTQNSINTNTVSSTNIDKNYSVMTGKEINEEISFVIDEFFSYCKNNQAEKAYELLSKECKEILYPTKDVFIKNYYNKLFTEENTYLYQAWITNNNRYTFKVDIIEDMLATGSASTTSITDYCTVVKNDGNYKLNINNFIGIENINKEQTKNNITIKLNRKRIYMNYETYEIEVINSSDEKIMLDGFNDSETVYLENRNKLKYYWERYEILEEDISLSKMQAKNIEIKFNKQYREKNETVKVVFSNIVLNGKNTMEMDILL